MTQANVVINDTMPPPGTPDIVVIRNGGASGSVGTLDLATISGYKGIKSAPTDAGLADILASSASPSLLSAIGASSNTAMQLAPPTGGSVAITVQGRTRTITTTAHTNDVATGGLYQMLADLSTPNASTFTVLLNAAGTALQPYQMLLCYVWYDTAVVPNKLQAALPSLDLSPVTGTTSSAGYNPLTFESFFSSGGTVPSMQMQYGTLPGTTPQTRTFPALMRGCINWSVLIQQPAPPASQQLCYIGLAVDGAVIQPLSLTTIVPPGLPGVVTGFLPIGPTCAMASLGAGNHSFQVSILNVTTTGSLTIINSQIYGQFYR